MLVERQPVLEQLEAIANAPRAEGGRVILIRGEAGIGKTVTLREFLTRLGENFTVLVGHCDDLLTARPLGPVFDIAVNEPEIADALESDDRGLVFLAVLELLQRSMRPTVLVIEDVHWADDATLDLIKFVGRRINSANGFLVLTYRDGEVPGDHPLRVALGDLPYGVVERIQLQPLTPEGVAALASEQSNPNELWSITGGNPFFVTEAARSHEDIPLSISDSVLGRLSRLTPDAQKVAELCSVSPSRIELAVVASIFDAATEHLTELEEAGLLEVHGESLTFRHELARRAIEDSLTEISRRHNNLQVLEVLELGGAPLARLAHHALESGDVDAILRYLPSAARKASSIESHVEAIASLRALEPYLDHFTEDELADHYDLWAYEEYLADETGSSLIQEAIKLREKLGDTQKLGNTLLSASRIAWVGSRRKEALELAARATEMLKPTGGEPLAMAYSTLSQLAMLDNDSGQTMKFGALALEIVGDQETRARAHALNNTGAVRMMNSYPEGYDELVESYEMSRRLGLAHDEARACVNIAWGYLWMRELESAQTWISKAQEVMAKAEMPAFESYAITMQAILNVFSGAWDEADELSESILERRAILGTSRASTTMAAAKLAVRRGRPNAESLTRLAVERALEAGELQRTAPAAEVLAEFGWLGGELSDSDLRWCLGELELTIDRGSFWNAGELAQWLWLLDVIPDIDDRLPEPYRLLKDGNWREAAAFWSEKGVPYAKAVALSLGNDEAKLESLEILDLLGAQPLASRIRSALQEAGIKGVPRGPQRTTRDHPLGLTARQQDVLGLLKDGLSNAEIADRLFISSRTVDHHVSAILAKLGAASRNEAVEIATASSM